MLGLESGQELISSNPDAINVRYYKRMILFTKYFPKNFSLSLPLGFHYIQRKESGSHRKLFKARTFLWYFEEPSEEPSFWGR